MAKYLHRYKSREDFEKDYYGSAPVTAFTVTGGTVSPGCSGDWTETHDFDGKYVFVEETTLTTTSLCDGSVWTGRVRIFKKGDVALYDRCNNAEEKWGSELYGYAAFLQDPSQAFQAGDAQLDVSNLEYGEPVYHEPWVSCTTDARLLSGTADALYDSYSSPYNSYSSEYYLLGTNITLTSMGRTGFYVDYSDQLV